MRPSSTSTSEAGRPDGAGRAGAHGSLEGAGGVASRPDRGFWAWLGGVATVLVVLPVLAVLAFSAHEPNCSESEAFWLGDLPTGPGEVDGVVLGSSQMGLDVDVHALAEATGHPWVRVARHAVEHASIPRTYPRMLASSPASPGLEHLVIEVSPLLFDEGACARKELDGIPTRAHWWGAARDMLGPEAELAPSVAMGWLPHRWIMTAGRRRDLVDHLTTPDEALALLRDLPRIFEPFSPPSRWEGEPVPELSDARIEKRRRFLFGGPLDGYVAAPSVMCLTMVERLVAAARPGKTVLVLPPLRARMRDAVPAKLRSALLAEVTALAARAPTAVAVWDATDAFAGREEQAFTDFDHLSASGAAEFTRALAERLTGPRSRRLEP